MEVGVVGGMEVPMWLSLDEPLCALKLTFAT